MNPLPPKAWSALRMLAPVALEVALVLGLCGLSAACRWTGQAPYGSDADEYLLVARALRATGEASVAGVEGTKYPLGYPLLIAGLEVLGLSPAVVGPVLNALALAALALVVRAQARAHGRVARLVAAAFVATGASLWNTAPTLGTDALSCLVVALAFGAARNHAERADVVGLCVLAACAVLLRSVGLAVALAASGALAAAGRAPRRRWWPVPAIVGLALAWVQRLPARGLPQHTTGYGATVRLRDPFDASRGVLEGWEYVLRALHALPAVLGDLGRAVVVPYVPWPLSALVALCLCAAAVWAARSRCERAFLTIFVAASAGVLLLWPYSDSRFFVPFVPIAAAGLAALVGQVHTVRAPRLRAWIFGLVTAVLVVHAGLSLRLLTRWAAPERDAWAHLHARTAALAAWAAGAVPPGERVASFDYRELALRLGRPVLPLPYTSDTQALWDASAGRGARWLVRTARVYPLRATYADALVTRFPERFERVYDDGTFAVYRVWPDGEGRGRSP